MQFDLTTTPYLYVLLLLEYELSTYREVVSHSMH